MKKKLSLILLILIFPVFTYGCSQKISLLETKGDYFKEYTNDDISIKISNTLKEEEYIYNAVLDDLQKINSFSPIHTIEIDIDEKNVIPKVERSIKCNSSFIKTEEFKKELIKKSYDIYDNWISEGLYAKIFKGDVEVLEFPEYYEEHDFSLFGARFFEPFASKSEIENVQAASINLVEYIIKKGKKEELLKNQVDISDIEEWGKDKNIDLSYQRSIESLMNRMEANKLNSNVYLTLNTKEDINGFIIDIQTMDEQYDTAKKIETFILMMDKNISNIKEGIKKDAPNFYNNYSDAIENIPLIHYYFDNTLEVNGFALTKEGIIKLKDLTTQVHEFSHILITDSFLNNNIVVNVPEWLDEGIANYFDYVYSDRYKFIIKGINDLMSEEKLNEHEENLINNMNTIFQANNMDLSNTTEIITNKSERIKMCHIWMASVLKHAEVPGFESVIKDTVFLSKEPRNSEQKSWPMGKGNYINYHANFSFTTYLIEEYGLEKTLYLMIEDFSTLTYEDQFGKSYEELKVDWREYLKDNIKDIELIL
ncbi:hypothetical protein [Clostridium algidicarnis]|uniref:hypothetical protein n=1 Tax=Clostridium algidicarnis TaxID=37659 RepID=UPI003FD7F634